MVVEYENAWSWSQAQIPVPSPCLLCSLGSCCVIEMIPWLIPTLAGGGNVLDVLIHSAPMSVLLVLGFVLVWWVCFVFFIL